MENSLKENIKLYCSENNIQIDNKKLNEINTIISNKIFKQSLISRSIAEHANRNIVSINDYNLAKRFNPINHIIGTISDNDELNFFDLFIKKNRYITNYNIKNNTIKGEYTKEFINELSKDINQILFKYF